MQAMAGHVGSQHRHIGAALPLSVERCTVAQRRLRAQTGSKRRRLAVQVAAEGGEGEGDSSRASDLRLPVSGSDTDWRDFRARLVAGSQDRSTYEVDPEVPTTSGNIDEGWWAHTVPRPEPGCLLVAHPLMFQRQQQYFDKAVIFLFQHSPEGSAGLILNKRTHVTLSDLSNDMFRPEFLDAQLNLGGDVGKHVLQLLHAQPGLRHSVEIVNGVYLGGLDAAKAAVRESAAQPSAFRWYAGYAGWAPGQLEEECNAGVWFTAAAGKGVILQETPGGKDAAQEQWITVMQLLGGQHAELAHIMRGMQDNPGSTQQPSEGS